MKKVFLAIVAALLVSSFGACQKKEEPAVAQKSPVPSGPIMDSQSAPPHGAAGPKTEFQVVIPEDVKGQWDAVVLVVSDKKANKDQEFTVKIGEELKIPDSTMTVKVGPFLPDFKMSGAVITSSSNELNNPSVGVAIFEDGSKVFPGSGEWGWLYEKFPTIHTFQHERFALALKKGVKK